MRLSNIRTPFCNGNKIIQAQQKGRNAIRVAKK